MNPIFKQKIKELKGYYYDDELSLKWVESQEKRLKAVIMKEKLGNSAAAAAIVDEALHRIEVINQLLQNDESLTAEERTKLFTERKVHKFWLDRFDTKTIQKQYDSISGALDKELKRIRE